MSQQNQDSKLEQRRLITHYTNRRLKEEGGRVVLTDIAYGIGDISNIDPETVVDVICDSAIKNKFRTKQTTARRGDQTVITSVVTIGDEPPAVTEEFGVDMTADATLISLPGIEEKERNVLNDIGIETPSDIIETNQDKIQDALVKARSAESEDIRSVNEETGNKLTQIEINDLDKNGITTVWDMHQAYNKYGTDMIENIDLSDKSTLQMADIDFFVESVDLRKSIPTDDEIEKLKDNAERLVQSRTTDTEVNLQRHKKRIKEHGEATAVVTTVNNEQTTVGDPLALKPSIDPDDPKAVYSSTIGQHKSKPQQTALPVLEHNPEHDPIPKIATTTAHSESGIPTDEEGNPVPPVIPDEPDLQVQLDIVLAEYIARSNPVRLVGHRGVGKNYLLKWLAYQTNRGYRSIDISENTTESDLFGILTPNDDGEIVAKNSAFKQGLIAGDIIALNEANSMSPGAMMSLHRLLNESVTVISSHGERFTPHPQAAIVITENPTSDLQYHGANEHNAAARGRFRTVKMGYPQTIDDELKTMDRQYTLDTLPVSKEQVKRIIEFAHRTRNEHNWPTLSVRNVANILDTIDSLGQYGTTPASAVTNELRHQVGARQNVNAEAAINAVTETL